MPRHATLSHLRAFLMTVAFVAAAGTFPIVAQEAPSKILYINSYHPGYQWGDDLFESFRDAFGDSGEIYVEYMDTKRFIGFRHNSRFLDYLESKYRNVAFSAVVTADDSAYRLLLDADSPLFRDTPAVFCGVTEYWPSQLWLRRNITGVVQNIALEETLTLILELHREAPAVVVLTDNTLNGRGLEDRVEAYAKRRGIADRLIFPNEMNSATLSSIRRLLREVPAGSAIYYLAFDVEATGRAVTPGEVFSVLRSRKDLPVYVSSTTYLSAGGIGGKLVTPERHGRLAAELTTRVLSGTPPDEIPVINRDTTEYIFDADELRRHNIFIPELPAGSTIRNTVVDRLAGSRNVIVAFAATIAALLISLFALLALNRVKARSAGALAYERQLFNTLMDQVPVPIFFKDRDGRLLRVNPAYAEFVGWEHPEELVGRSDEDLFPEEFTAGQRALEERIMESGQGVENNLEEHPQGDGTSRWYLVTKMPWEGKDGSAVGIVGISREVTEEIEAKERLQRALKDREVLLREVHHRTKNNLQLVVSMLNLQQHVLVAESAREALDQAKSRVHSMAMLHEHLHKSPDVGQLKLGDYLEAVVAHATGLARSGLSLSVETKSDGCLVDLEQAVHIGLIVNELVTNAVKHAFPDQDQGAIVLTVREEVEEVLISVEDNGKGMVSGGLADHGSMGMQIVNALTEQIGATIALEGDHGTRWLLRVPEQSDTATQSH